MAAFAGVPAILFLGLPGIRIEDDALEACERYYQAFQYVLWAGKSPEDALAAIMLETQGQA